MFAKLLLEWYENGHRDLPWRRTSDPYAIWVSEIMLQQTRVATVIPYYERFLSLFPTPAALADAPEDKLLGAWAGLGYYSRVRNMQRAAREMNGRFPEAYDAIRALPGIGDYTAAAVGSIAFGMPRAAVDGNVLRVLSRVTDDAGDIGSAIVKQRLTDAAQERLDPAHPGEFNQAMMELGATVCLPRDPQCLLCPVRSLCRAFANGRQNQLPVKLRRTEIHRKTRRVYIVRRDGSLLLWRRTNRSEKLAGFWELPEPEHFAGREPAATQAGEFRHAITNHQYLFEVFVTGPLRREPQLSETLEHAWIPVTNLDSYVLSTTARKALATASVLAL